MGKEYRLRRSREFEAVKATGGVWSDRLLVLRLRPNGMPISRFGFTVGSHVGVAVKRNKTKRRLREVVWRTAIEDGWDVVVIARQGASLARFRELERSLTGLLRKARIAA